MTLKLVAAGGTFAGSALLGLVLGIWLAGRTNQPLWVLGGIFAGLALGGWSAFRMLVQELR
ncbi:MAG: AtpZ/AtpI family protein [Candidatus Eremiobacteraeota bacterium]|nr:AtpZ/AtpI family protein [Candidatus Eremiobacteraeota bacterium]